MNHHLKEFYKKSMYQVMEAVALKIPSDICVSFYGKRYTFKKMLHLVDCGANALSNLGLKRGDVATLCIPNTPSAIIAFYALNKLGVIVNLVHPKVPVAQLNESIKTTNSTALICYDLYLKNNKPSFDGLIIVSKSNHFMGAVAKTYFKLSNKKIPKAYPIFEKMLTNPAKINAEEFELDQPAIYLPSGGTTGKPKIIVHCNQAFIDLCGYMGYFASEDLSKYKCMYTVLPIFHGFGLCLNMHMCMQTGFKNVMSIKFNPKSLAKSIKREGVSILMGVPSMFVKLLKCKQFLRADLSAIKDCFVGGDTVSSTLINEFNAVLSRQGSKARLLEGYGLTETVTVNAVNHKNHFKMGSAGVALPNTQIKILIDGKKWADFGETGEIAINTHIKMLGYLHHTQSPFKEIDGQTWLLTGDLAMMDKDGFIFFKQRRKNLIKVSGVPVFPCEIEEVVLGVEGVERAVAIGTPNQDTGEVVKLFVQPSINADESNLTQNILEACKLKLIPYAIPKQIVFNCNLPLNEMGKIDRSKLS